MVISSLSPAKLLSEGHARQIEALKETETDETVPLKEYAIKPRLMPVEIQPLSLLLSMPPLPPPASKKSRAEAMGSALVGKPSHRASKKAKYRYARAVKRRDTQIAAGSATKAYVKRHIAAAAASATTVDQEGSSVIPAGRWGGPKVESGYPKVYSVTEVLKLSGLVLIKANGCVDFAFALNALTSPTSKSRAIQTADGYRLMAHCAAPEGPEWLKSMEVVDQALEMLFLNASAPTSGRRGEYASLPCGYGFGGGRTMPGSYVNTPHNSPLIRKVLAIPAIQNIARMVDRGLLSFFPKLHALLTNLDEKIVDVDNPEIERAFPGCCYPACHLNLHNACTLTHLDFFNLVFSMCAVASAGPFDHTRGGHIIAWSLGLVIEFPSGSTVYLPSACVDHGNIPVAAHERRHSMAFFVPAGLARWYHNGFRSDKEFCELASPEQLTTWIAYKAKLWEVGMELLHIDS